MGSLFACLVNYIFTCLQGKILFSISINFAHPVAFDYGNYNGRSRSAANLWVSKKGTSTKIENKHQFVNCCCALVQCLIEHPQFLNNQLFIGGDSYSSIPVPMIVQHVVDGNQIAFMLCT